MRTLILFLLLTCPSLATEPRDGLKSGTRQIGGQRVLIEHSKIVSDGTGYVVNQQTYSRRI